MKSLKPLFICAITTTFIFSSCKKSKESEQTSNNSSQQTTTPIMEGYLNFVHDSSASSINFIASTLFWENINGNKTYQDPDSVSINWFWIPYKTTSIDGNYWQWNMSSPPPFASHGSIVWHTTGSSKVPAINYTISPVPFVDDTYLPADADLSDFEISLSKSAGFTFSHPTLSATFTKYYLVSSIIGVANSEKKIEKIVTGVSTGVTFTAADLSVLSSPSYSTGTIYLDSYIESVISPASSTSFTINNIGRTSSPARLIN